MTTRCPCSPRGCETWSFCLPRINRVLTSNFVSISNGSGIKDFTWFGLYALGNVKNFHGSPPLTGPTVSAVLATALASNVPCSYLSLLEGSPTYHGSADLAAIPLDRGRILRSHHFALHERAKRKLTSLKRASLCQSSTVCCTSLHQLFVALVSVNSTPHLARVTHANTLFRVAQGGVHASQSALFCVIS